MCVGTHVAAKGIVAQCDKLWKYEGLTRAKTPIRKFMFMLTISKSLNIYWIVAVVSHRFWLPEDAVGYTVSCSHTDSHGCFLTQCL